MATTLAVSSILAYLLAAVLAGRALQPKAGGHGALLVAALAVALHAVYQVLPSARAGVLLLDFFAALSAVGLGVALLTVVVAALRPVLALGTLAFPLAAASLLLYHLLPTPEAAQPAGDWRIQLHALLALLAYAALSVAALVAIMLWFQERALRRHQLRALLAGFPPLTLSEALLFRLIQAGFLLLTVALVTGVLFIDDLFAQHLVHKTILSLLAWIVFGALLFGRLRYGWRGRRAVQLVLVAMVLLLLAFFGSKFVLELVLGRAR